MQETAAFSRPLQAATRSFAVMSPLSASAEDSSSSKEPSASAAATVEGDEEEDLFGDMDFEAGFNARLQKEGGLEGLKAKAAEKKRDEMKQKIQGQLNQWQGDQAILIVCALVLVVVGLALSTPEPFERGSNGEELLFGLKASDW